MTQKELSYLEDAVGHETNIIKILASSISNLEDEKLTNFLESERTKHEEMKEKLMNKLEAKTNE